MGNDSSGFLLLLLLLIQAVFRGGIWAEKKVGDLSR